MTLSPCRRVPIYLARGKGWTLAEFRRHWMWSALDFSMAKSKELVPLARKAVATQCPQIWSSLAQEIVQQEMLTSEVPTHHAWDTPSAPANRAVKAILG